MRFQVSTRKSGMKDPFVREFESATSAQTARYLRDIVEMQGPQLEECKLRRLPDDVSDDEQFYALNGRW
jgi:hypothetical protein